MRKLHLHKDSCVGHIVRERYQGKAVDAHLIKLSIAESDALMCCTYWLKYHYYYWDRMVWGKQ